MHFIPLTHYESHGFQSHLVVEVLPANLEGFAWEISLKEQVELVVVVVLPWVLPEVSIVG